MGTVEMVSSYTIEEAEVSDAAAIAQLHVVSWQDSYKRLLPVEVLDNLDVERRTQSWKKILSSRGAHQATFVARQDGAVIGVIDVGPEQTGDLDIDGEITSLYVAKAHRGTSLAPDLMKRGAQALVGFGFTSAAAWVFEDNDRAKVFFENLGGNALDYRDEIMLEGNVLSELPYAWVDLVALIEKCGPAIGRA